MRSLLSILILALLLTSCTKEDVVAPGVQAQEQFTTGSSFTKGANDDGASDPDAGTISDDGDDLNDGEGRRKKKKP